MSQTMKFAICSEIFKEWDLEKAMRFIKETGYDAIEIAPFTLAKHVTDIAPEKRREIREMAARSGLAISGIHWVLVGTEGMHLTHPDPLIRAKTADYFVQLVDFCSDLGGQTIVVGSPKQRNLEEGIEMEQGRAWALEVFRPSIRRAEEKGVVICFEPLAPVETNFINTAEEAIRFVQEIESEHFKVILDVKAMSSEAKAIPDIITGSARYMAYFHANDANLKGPGFGDVDFKPIFDALTLIGYSGYVSVEVFDFTEGPEQIASESLRYMKEKIN